MSKLKKLKRLLNSKGIRLRKPCHWLCLVKRGCSFIIRHGLHSYKALCDSYYTSTCNEESAICTQSEQAAQQEDTQQTHTQIWARIQPTNTELANMCLTIPNLIRKYSFTFILSEEDINTISYIENQIYDKFEILTGGFDECPKAKGDYIMFLQPGDFLHENALFEIVVELNRIKKMPSLLYFDHDYFVGELIDKPYYKPGWSPDLLLVNNYINRACVIRRDLLKKTETVNEPFHAAHYDILLKVTELETAHHIPGILLTMPDANDERAYDSHENLVRENALVRRGIDGVIKRNKYGVASIERKLIGHPKVSIIIPTCYAGPYIENCLNSIEQLTTYDNYEVIIVDNSRKEPNYGRNRLKDYNCRIIYIDEPFNWSRLNNLGANEAIGDVCIFLNDDTQVITPDWIERMTVEAQRPEIGVVDVMLLFPNNTIYSAGVYFQNDRYSTWHSFLHEKENSTVYHNMLHYTRQSMSFSGACFAIEKSKLDEAHGFDESFPIYCNEMALYFKLISRGYCTIYLAEVQLLHHHSASINEIERDKIDDFVKESYEHLEEVFGLELQNRSLSNTYLDTSMFSENLFPVVYRHFNIHIPCDDTTENEICLSEEIVARVELQISDMPLFSHDLVVGLYINAESSLPLEKLSQLCDLLISRLDARMVLFCNEHCVADAQEVISLVKNNHAIFSVSDTFSEEESHYVVKRVDYLISSDGFFAKNATLQGIPTLIILRCDDSIDESAANGQSVMQVQCATSCNPCDVECECIKKIHPYDVYYGLERLITLYPKNFGKLR